MGAPSRPKVQHQGPDSNCIINGRFLGWDSCTAYSAAMGIDKSSLGTKQPTGCSVRRYTGDTTGGLTLRQVADVATGKFGVTVLTYTGANVMAPADAADRLLAGHGLIVQGDAVAMLGTPHRSTGGSVNHAVWVNEGRGWKKINGHWIPAEVYVYDPAADGRHPGIDQAPSWWPWSLLLKFAAELRPWGDSRKLGPGKFYTAVFPDTEPHAHYRFNGKRPPAPVHQPDRTRALTNGVRIHSSPSSKAKIIGYLAKDQLWEGWQYAPGTVFQGSTLWLGNHNGDGWVHSKRLSHVGGTT